MTAVTTGYLWLDDRGVAWVDDTNTKVIEIVLDRIAYGLSPEEIASEHYSRLSLAQIHAALAYYYDHQAAFDAEIERQVHRADALRARTADSPGRTRLRAARGLSSREA
jgi:uncharacterized protein (DUF433 family)